MKTTGDFPVILREVRPKDPSLSLQDDTPGYLPGDKGTGDLSLFLKWVNYPEVVLNLFP